jgi:hypothetical protein
MQACRTWMTNLSEWKDSRDSGGRPPSNATRSFFRAGMLLDMLFAMRERRSLELLRGSHQMYDKTYKATMIGRTAIVTI